MLAVKAIENNYRSIFSLNEMVNLISFILHSKDLVSKSIPKMLSLFNNASMKI